MENTHTDKVLDIDVGEIMCLLIIGHCAFTPQGSSCP